MLEVKDLSVTYTGIRALRSVSLNVASGTITTVVGSNGAGKSSLLKAISGLIRADGDIRFEGHVISGLDAPSIVRAGIAHVPEGRELFGRMSVEDNLRVGAFTRHDRAAVRRDFELAYAMFPVLSLKRRNNARGLSGGEQQMLAFARAMMSAPRLYLLDEPSIGLSPLMEEHLMASIMEICVRTGAGVLLVEQNVRLALEISEHAYVLEHGAVTLAGPSKTLVGDPAIAAAYLGMV